MYVKCVRVYVYVCLCVYVFVCVCVCVCLLQRVDHAPRVHLDFETDDQPAEAARLAALGARTVGQVKSWTVMEAPTGHRFCLVAPQGDDFPGAAAAWP